MKTDQAYMLLDSYFEARTRRNDILRRPEPRDHATAAVRYHDQNLANIDYIHARDTLVTYLREVPFKP